MDESTFRAELQRRQEAAEAALGRFLPKDTEHGGRLAKAMRYSLLAGGKRVRPVLLSESFRLCGGRGALAEPFMAAIEMIHTHSLVHDDLPALDNDLLRRGQPTTHAAFGEALGVLAGDALLNLAYETALQAFGLVGGAACGAGETAATDRGSTAGAFGEAAAYARVSRALRILAAKAGYRGMLGGQGLDVQNEKNNVRQLSQGELDWIYRHKTAALLEAPLMIGAVLAGAPEDIIAAMGRIGDRLGMAFQIRDDILDVTSTEAALGKPIGSDDRNDKTTYVTLLGIEGAANEVRRLTGEALDTLELAAGQLPGDPAFLRAFLAQMAERTH